MGTGLLLVSNPGGTVNSYDKISIFWYSYLPLFIYIAGLIFQRHYSFLDMDQWRFIVISNSLDLLNSINYLPSFHDIHVVCYL